MYVYWVGIQELRCRLRKRRFPVEEVRNVSGREGNEQVSRDGSSLEEQFGGSLMGSQVSFLFPTRIHAA